MLSDAVFEPLDLPTSVSPCLSSQDVYASSLPKALIPQRGRNHLQHEVESL